MNLEIAIKEKDNVVKLKIISPDKPLVIELTTNDLGTPATVAAEQNESASPVTETATADETLKAEANALSAKLAAMNREYERVKKAAYRAGKRLKANLKALGQTTAMSATSTNRPSLALVDVPCSVPRVPEACPQGIVNVPNGDCTVPRVPEVSPHGMATVPNGDFAVPGTCPQNVPSTVPGDTWGQGQAVTSYYGTTNNTNTVIHNHVFDNDFDNVIDPTMSDHAMSHKEAETTNTQSPEPSGNCLPFVPEETSRKFIPLTNLPEMYRNIVTAWNDLPLPEKLKGLYPDVAQKLYHLLKEFGEATLHKAIRMVADSPFLLGKSSNSSGWVIHFGWLLKPGNLKKILENKYRARSWEWKQGNECITFPEYIPWSTVKDTVNHATVTANGYTENMVNRTTVPANGYESLNAATGYGDSLPDKCSADKAAQGYFLDPEYMLKGLDPLTDQARSNLARAAARLGLTKTSAA